ncbi:MULTISPECIES: NADH-quinone oxidoreductase subunit NuoH [Ralstonia]|jgi:NADH:ubiquinone oxidoreductase subunit 1 (chain H)|uniref:NADH-quinone oxidoreductase subunit H n=5 Tax=Bacteria TaxID=2 RepID=NUOH_RALPJ|nr:MULTISPECIES: NADH-quinone oxidoreductase subunit NuoH [Ralstonia]B2U7Q4.1 RecName: Full=NADH-quinone oxidoreductase subunit H; AltName: Full=NADH dehydrogenase I subunit H; AltName: Full=NDH-1 subunit H [Ralstonia pickettii 12J]MBB0023021.1 NADH-quinone oxidoreductase subunit H [Ralstonia pickettii]MBB0033578.1 NADH-quinone oxidoreductase subunit H [Ralstonia pickettii]MBB0095893.1 NADH-quinone oxidoreductase subunit H [Ralstonia pickettii]MBB0106046.1 NADH-quinone oxidoreductase subunit H
MIESITSFGTATFGGWWPLVWTLVRAVCIILPLLLCVAYLILWERKLIGWMHVRLGPNRVGPMGLLQPIADVLKLLLKEVMVPSAVSRGMYIIAPLMVLMPAVAIWAVIPFQAEAMVSNINAGLLYVMAISSVGVYGVILAGWASNSKYAFLGAMRASAQMISYEIAMGFALVTVLMVTGSLNLSDIVNSQNRGFFAGHGINILSWNWLPLLPMFGVYFISGVAETNRHPFDVVEGESEIVAGHMIEYSGMAFALFFLAEYINMIVISALTATLFLGGWASPIDAPVLNWIPGFFWLLIKVFLLLSVFIWLRASFPRYRYDQIMRLGWKIFIPLTVGWLVVVAIWLVSPWNIWK